MSYIANLIERLSKGRQIKTTPPTAPPASAPTSGSATLPEPDPATQVRP